MRDAWTEAEFTDAVLREMGEQGWRTYHMHISGLGKKHLAHWAADSRGFPDIVAVRPPRLLFAELKKKGGYLRNEQQLWLAQLEDAGAGIGYEHPAFEVYVWRPRDWETIVEVVAAPC